MCSRGTLGHGVLYLAAPINSTAFAWRQMDDVQDAYCDVVGERCAPDGAFVLTAVRSQHGRCRAP